MVDRELASPHAQREFAVPKKPDTFEIPYKFPEDLTILPSEDLGKWYSRLGAYRGYAQRLLGIAEIKQMDAEKEWKDIIAFETYSRECPNKTVTAIKNEVMSLENVQTKKELYDKQRKEVIFLSMLEKVYDGHISVISREMSRRKIGESE